MKKWLACFLALVLLTTLVGCSGKDIAQKVNGLVDGMEDKLGQVEEGLNDLGDKLSGTEPDPTEAPAPTEEPAQEPAEAPADAADDGIRPEFKEAMDSYEQFFNEYAAFMQSYDASDLSAMTKYLSMMSQYADAMEKLDDMEDEEMSDEELNYYTQVMLRINQTLLEATGSVSG